MFVYSFSMCLYMHIYTYVLAYNIIFYMLQMYVCVYVFMCVYMSCFQFCMSLHRKLQEQLQCHNSENEAKKLEEEVRNLQLSKQNLRWASGTDCLEQFLVLHLCRH